MKSRFALATLAAVVAAPMIASAPAQAQYYGGSYGSYQEAPRGYYDRYDRGPHDRGYYAGGPTYYGRDVRYYRGCRRSSGTTGLLAGGAGGALIGSALGGGPLGTVLGAVGGGLLGRDLDRRHDAAQNWRNGC